MRGRLFDATLSFFHSPVFLYPVSTLWYGAALIRFGATGLLYAGVPFSLFFGFIACVFCFQNKQGDWSAQQTGLLEMVLVVLALASGLVPGLNLAPAWLVGGRRRRRRLQRLQRLAAAKSSRLGQH